MSKLKHIFIFAAVAFLFMLAGALSSFAGNIIADPAKPLWDTASKLRAGDHLQLQRGRVYDLGAHRLVLNMPVTIESIGSGPLPRIRYRGEDWKTAILAQPGASGSTFRAFAFNGGSKNLLIDLQVGVSNVTLEGLLYDEGYGLQIGRGNSNVIIRSCGAWIPSKGGLFYFGGRGAAELNRGITFDRCYSVGSIDEHPVRLHNSDGVTFTNCLLLNPDDLPGGRKKGMSYNLKDVRNVLVKDCIGDKVTIGPLADRDGGLYDPVGAERDRKLSLRAENIRFENFTCFGGYILVEAGANGVVFDKLHGWQKGNGGYAITLMSQYGPRKPPDVTLSDVEFTADKGLTAGEKMFLRVSQAVRFNGKALSPTTQASK